MQSGAYAFFTRVQVPGFTAAAARTPCIATNCSGMLHLQVSVDAVIGLLEQWQQRFICFLVLGLAGLVCTGVRYSTCAYVLHRAVHHVHVPEVHHVVHYSALAS